MKDYEKDIEYLEMLATEKRNIDWVRLRQVADHYKELIPAKKKKPIELVSYVGSPTELRQAVFNPKAYDHIELLYRDSNGFDIMVAWNEGDVDYGKCVFLGHWNDGVKE